MTDPKYGGRWIPVGVDHNDDDIFDLAAQVATERVPLGAGAGWLLVNIREEVLIDFAVFDFAQSDVDGSNARFHLLFHGHGTGATLRECRHIYWRPADNGYVFYAPFQVIIDAFTALRKWFDGD